MSQSSNASLDRTLAAGAEPEPKETRTDRGASIGRYVVVERLGAGAMGVVFAAYDPQLDRKVAIKLLRAAHGNEADQVRLQREALALAKLSHANVVGVHDVGVHEGRVFVAMEFVAGQTLGEWMRGSGPEGLRPWKSVVRVFLDAGRGLAAAHARGLVHRDFKPDNVMIDDGGRVRVMDFGLARTDEDTDSIELPTDEDSLAAVRSQTSSLSLSLRLTRTGTLLGTPAYMAPEQFAGKAATASSDQYAFCTALYEALYGGRPHLGTTMMELIAAVTLGTVEEPPRSSKVPAWVRRVVLRGLALEPVDRFPTMDELLAALADDPAVRRRTWLIGLGAVVAVGGGAWGLVASMQPESEACTQMELPLATVWDDARRAEVREAIEGTQLDYAPATWTRVEQRLDEYSSQWVRARTEACEATQRGVQSAELLDLRMTCLDERLRSLRATVDVLAHADSTVVEKAVPAVAHLPGLERCADASALTAEIPLPDDPAVAEQVAVLEGRLAEAAALEEAGKLAESLAIASEILAAAEPLEYRPLLVRAWLLLGEVHTSLADYPAGEAAFERSYRLALELGLLREAGAAATGLVDLVGSTLARHEHGRRWALDADPLTRGFGGSTTRIAYLNSLGTLSFHEGEFKAAAAAYESALELSEASSDTVRAAALMGNLGGIAITAGDLPRARDYLERALALERELLGPEHPRVGRTLANIGIVSMQSNDFENARDHFERALDIETRALGPEHPTVATTINSLGAAFIRLGDLERGIQSYERALAIKERVLGDHPEVAGTLQNLGNAMEDLGDLERARAYHLRSLAIREATLGLDHHEISMGLTNLGRLELRSGNSELARQYCERSRVQLEKQEHPSQHFALSCLGEVAEHEGDFSSALAYHQRALEIREATLGPDHPDIAWVLGNIGRTLLGAGKAEEAVPLLERAIAIWGPDTDDLDRLPSLAKTQLVLASALWDLPEGRGRDRARKQAETARATFERAAGPSATPRRFEELAEADAWLASHR